MFFNQISSVSFTTTTLPHCLMYLLADGTSTKSYINTYQLFYHIKSKNGLQLLQTLSIKIKHYTITNIYEDTIYITIISKKN